MNVITVVWIICGVLIMFSMGLFVLIISGRDIMLAMMRFFNKKGVDVFMASSSRNLTQYYKTPKENKLKINNLTYICNPEKTENLQHEDKLRVYSSILARDQRLDGRISALQKRVDNAEEVKKAEGDEKARAMISVEIERMKHMIGELQAKKNLQQQNYFKDRRPAFFYIEGDPIPKDFHEWYSGLDSKILDNLTAGQISIPPVNVIQNEIKLLKLLCIAAAGAACIAAFLEFRSAGNIKVLCAALKVVCK